MKIEVAWHTLSRTPGRMLSTDCENSYPHTSVTRSLVAAQPVDGVGIDIVNGFFDWRYDMFDERIDERIEEIEELCAAEGLTLPMAGHEIIDLEDDGYWVDLFTGDVGFDTDLVELDVLGEVLMDDWAEVSDED